VVLTDGSDEAVARRLSESVAPFASVSTTDTWMPRGFADSREARLGEALNLLEDQHRLTLRSWWLAVNHPLANTPNWDIASTATVAGRRGLVLVEAKAHTAELSPLGKAVTATTNAENHIRIQACCEEATAALNQVVAGWSLTADQHYQLCNRFAFGWKLASLGVPTVLVYLGFLNAMDMCREGEPFRSDDEWRQQLLSHGRTQVPVKAWGAPLNVNGTPLIPLIRSIDISLE
jgi:hypothetical protein